MENISSAITQEECLYLQQHQDDPDMMFYASLGVNFLLLITTGSSELMAGSKCKHNSILQLIGHLFSNKNRGNSIDEDAEKKEIV
tara:strand:- start:1362 stop:1616 length:255 start_codon:yes stop_codon:yes gene_type:complete